MTAALEYNKDINEKFISICKPLLDHLDLSHFIYINLLADNKRLYLCNDLKWVEKYTQYKLHDDPKHENLAIVPSVKPECVYWASYGNTRVFDAARNHNMSNGFIIYEGNEIFSFATKNEKTNVVYSYIEKFNILKHFILYFKCNAKNIIKTYDNNILINTTPFNKPAEPQSQFEYEKILKEMKISKFCLDYENIHALLSPRELEYLVHLASGKSAKEISWILNITDSTSETHMEHIKSKLGCFSKSQVIGVFLKSNLRHLTPDNVKYALGKHDESEI